MLPGSRTNNSSTPSAAARRPHQEQAGPQSEQSQKSATFLRRPACWAGHPERTIIRFPTSWAKNEQKKPELEALAFSEQSPFLCN
tara:strand:- start:468 stop:722 length:255 start_codon:yes stop_codon:yes gene_type:complete